MRHGLLPALSLFLQPWLFLFSNTAATGISGGLGQSLVQKKSIWLSRFGACECHKAHYFKTNRMKDYGFMSI